MTLFSWNSTQTTLIGVASGASTACLFLPLMIFYLYKYYKFRHNLMLKKRYSNLTLIQVVLCCCIVLGMSLFEISIANVFVGSGIAIPAAAAEFSLMCAVGVENIVLFRMWLITFDNNFVKATQQHSQWKSLITGKHDQGSKSIKQYNWWMKHRDDWGNFYFVEKIVIIKLIIELSIILVPWTFVYVDIF